jgi:hypothetical protein
MTSMSNKLDSTLKTHPAIVLRNVENLISAGLTLDEVAEILEELEAWLSATPQFVPDLWEGPDGWYKQFHSFVIEGNAGETNIARIRRKAGLGRWRGVDIDKPESWKKRIIHPRPN